VLFTSLITEKVEKKCRKYQNLLGKKKVLFPRSNLAINGKIKNLVDRSSSNEWRNENAEKSKYSYFVYDDIFSTFPRR